MAVVDDEDVDHPGPELPEDRHWLLCLADYGDDFVQAGASPQSTARSAGRCEVMRLHARQHRRRCRGGHPSRHDPAAQRSQRSRAIRGGPSCSRRRRCRFRRGQCRLGAQPLSRCVASAGSLLSSSIPARTSIPPSRRRPIKGAVAHVRSPRGRKVGSMPFATGRRLSTEGDDGVSEGIPVSWNPPRMAAPRREDWSWNT